MGKAIWAEPRDITDLDDCYFYHTMEIPGYGIVHGEWDLRGGEADYLGKVRLVRGCSRLQIRERRRTSVSLTG
jgi:hypothetical protein